MAGLDLSDAQFASLLRFDVRVSARYHDRRRAFLSAIERWCQLVPLAMGVAMLYSLGQHGALRPWVIWTMVIGLFLVVVGVRCADRADRHGDRRRRLVELEAAMVRAGREAERIYLEGMAEIGDEPPRFRALVLLCNNAQLAADGVRDSLRYVPVRWCQRWTCQVLPWSRVRGW